MFVQLQFDQEARRAMILQIGHFKDNVIFCRFLSWFLFYEYLIYLNAVLSNGTFGALIDTLAKESIMVHIVIRLKILRYSIIYPDVISFHFFLTNLPNYIVTNA